ncbi:MAG: permease [Chloroflexota bacterium]|nr:permease [Chloroflexota bacterium]
MKNKNWSPKIDTTTAILIAISIVLLIFMLIKDKTLAFNGIKMAGMTLWNNLAILLVGFLLAGLIQVLIPKALIADWLGNQAGFKAVFFGCLAGGLIPGSPYAAFPIAAGFYKAGAGMGAMVGFISAWSLWSVTRLPIEIALIDPKLALIRYGITFIVPPAAGLLAFFLEKNIL